MLVEVAGAVVPVAVEAVGAGVHAAKHVFQAPLLEPGDGVTFGLGHVGGAYELLGFQTFAVFGATLKSPSTTTGSSGECWAASQSGSVSSHTSLRS